MILFEKSARNLGLVLIHLIVPQINDSIPLMKNLELKTKIQVNGENAVENKVHL